MTKVPVLHSRISNWIAYVFGGIAIWTSCPGHPGWAQQASASEHVALIVANGQMGTPLSIDEPSQSAAEVEKRLRLLGFRIVGQRADGCGEGGVQAELSLTALREAVACFETSARGAKQAVVYFSGYATHIDTENYLLPAGTDVSQPLDAQHLLKFSTILDAAERAAPGLLVVVVDGPRAGLKSIATKGVGLIRVSEQQLSRVVAFSAPVGSWVEENVGSTPPPDDKEAGQKAAVPTKSYSARLIEALDDDIDQRTLGLPGMGLAELFGKAALLPNGNEMDRRAELVVEGHAAKEVLGRVPKLGESFCEKLVWRAEKLGNCLEIAAAFDQCGQSSEVRLHLAKQCPKDLEAISHIELRSALSTAMKLNSCAGFETLFRRFDEDSFVNVLEEYKEAKSLGQYKCTIEANERISREFEQVAAKRDCAAARQILKTGGDLMSSEMRTKVEKLVGDVCCPNVDLQDKCISRMAATARFAKMLEEKGCTMGRNKNTKAARTKVLMERTNNTAELGIDLNSDSLLLDPLWEKMQKMAVTECSCSKKEYLSATGVCMTRK